MSKAKFKVGISNEDDRLHDLIIDVALKDQDTFKVELIKYLKNAKENLNEFISRYGGCIGHAFQKRFDRRP